MASFPEVVLRVRFRLNK